ncbi:MAG: peptide deformylase [Firmicutes bacterium]|nr:peptide deformylase [Bacillota bacterium]
MALRTIRINGDEILRKKCRIVDEIKERELVLLDDMLETMYAAEGVGLAAPQVGILKRLVVIDIGEGPIKLVNPEIVEATGDVVDYEGCLSVPGEQGNVNRPETVKVTALNEKGEKIEITGSGLMARALCHEIDHLDGVLFIDKVIPEEEEEF